MKGTDTVVKRMDDILVHVNLTVKPDGVGLILDTEQQETINNLQQSKSSRRREIDVSKKKTARTKNQNEPDDGRCVVLLQPTISSSEDSNVRRSTRTRKAIFHAYQ